MRKLMLLKVESLYKDFRLRSGLLGRSSRLQAVKDVSFVVPASGSLAIVGETGSGKTTVARIVVGLEEASSGMVEADGTVLSPKPGPDERRRRARMMQMVFQNPVMSLDPHQSIGAAIYEVVSFHGLRPQAECDARVRELLDAVGLDLRLTKSRPQNLSGGQCQRAAIARVARGRTGALGARRAGLGARRLDPGADSQPVGRPQGAARHQLAHHLS